MKKIIAIQLGLNANKQGLYNKVKTMLIKTNTAFGY